MVTHGSSSSTTRYRLEPGIRGTLEDSELAAAIERLRENDALHHRLIERGCGVNRAFRAFDNREGSLTHVEVDCIRDVVAAAKAELEDGPQLQGVSTTVAQSIAETIVDQLTPTGGQIEGVTPVEGGEQTRARRDGGGSTDAAGSTEQIETSTSVARTLSRTIVDSLSTDRGPRAERGDDT